MDLEGAGFPDGARVYLNAYHKLEFRRFDFGRVENIGPREELSLKGVGFVENLKFRVLVTDKNSRIVGIAEEIKPEIKAGRVESLLPVIPDDIGKELWKIDYSGRGGMPELFINSKIDGVLEMAESDPVFRLSSYPAILREILQRIVYIEDEVMNPENLSGWHKKWMDFACMIATKKPPDVLHPSENNFNDNEVEKWINSVTEEFSNRRISEWKEVNKEDFGR